jgi:hypothetical protein
VEKRKLGRPKKYETGAQRVAAHRLRHRAEKLPTNAEILRAARQLDVEIGMAAMEGNTLALRLRGRNSVDTLNNLRQFFLDDRREPDPLMEKLQRTGKFL